MSFANIQGKLTRNEMKNLTGGAYFNCFCYEQTGSWTYTSQPTTQQLQNDINTYCRYGGRCDSAQQ